MIDWLYQENIVTSKNKINPNKKTQYQIDTIMSATFFAPEHYTLTERIHLILNNIKEIPKCKECDNKVIFSRKTKTLGKYCSSECSRKSKERTDNSRKSSIKKYGQHHLTLKENLAKIDHKKRYIAHRKAVRKKYGVEYVGQLNKPKFILDIEDIDFFDEHINQKKSCVQIAQENGIAKATVHKYAKKQGVNLRRHNISTTEKHLQSFFPNAICNDRIVLNGKELDLYFPENNLAVEVNGVYWHSEEKTDKYHLLEKQKKCKELGIDLLHFWDIEINNKLNIVLSIIKSKLNQFDEIIYARKTDLREITDSKLCRNFLDNNHIQGYAPSSKKFGLYKNNELISIMTFGKSRFDNSIEMIRYCNKINTKIIGGASKLFKPMLSENVVSYCDKRIFSGKVYETLGFIHEYDTNPNYWYFQRDDRLHSRMTFQKHKLKDKLKIFDENLTEYENMRNNGFNRVWDCGNKKYIRSNEKDVARKGKK